MRTPTCSNCGKTIPSDDVNVARDVAFCRACNLAYPLSSLASGLALDARNGGKKKEIIAELKSGRLVKFGSMLRDERCRYLAAAADKIIRGQHSVAPLYQTV